MPNLLPYDGEAYLTPAVFSPEECEKILTRLETEIAWKQEPIRIFGKMVMQPRLTAWYGEKEYRYSGITMKPNAWSETLLELKLRVEPLAKTTFNSALLNFYRTSQDSMGWHRDNEKELGENPVIGSLSFGAERRFLLRHREKKTKVEVMLPSGSFLLMRGSSQHDWEHSLPKITKPTGARINLTFRVVQG